jgi:hypothetical protein
MLSGAADPEPHYVGGDSSAGSGSNQRIVFTHILQYGNIFKDLWTHLKHFFVTKGDGKIAKH